MKPLSRKWLRKKHAPQDLKDYVSKHSYLEFIPLLNLMVQEGHLEWVEWIVKITGKPWDVKSRQKYRSGDESPYWDYLQGGGETIIKANPDILSTESALWPSRDAEQVSDEEKKMDIVRAVYMTASTAECRAFDMVVSRGYTYRRAARELHTTESNIHEAIVRFKNKCQKILEGNEKGEKESGKTDSGKDYR